MTNHKETRRKANLTGILWMIAAMAAFAVEDAFIKLATRQIPVGQVLLFFGAGGVALFAWLARRSGATLLDRQTLSRVMLIRALCEFVGRLFYVLAIALTPLSSTTAILQATPLIVVLGATVFFGEKVGWKRWCAIAVGLLGVVIVLRPAADDFSALSLFAVLGTLGFAGRDLASRAAPPSISTQILGLYGFMTLIAAGAVYSLWEGKLFVWPSLSHLFGLIAAVATGVFAYTALMKAMRSGAIATVTPFRYTRLLFGLSLGIGLFGERLDAVMVLGCAVVISAGLFIWWQGRRDNA